MTNIENQTAIVTGSGSGIGRATAQRIARDGAYTVVADIDSSGAEATVEEIRQAGGEGIALHCDVTQSE